ncbi:MAG: CoA transferase [Mycobacteriaceae bacterium]|nr:CoA transferase [Mycobacteriaceae bacterium]
MTSLGIPDAVLARATQVAREIVERLDELGGRRIRVVAEEILTGRAALLGLGAPGTVSAGGSSRLLAAADHWWALTLSRPDDVDAVPALLELPDASTDPWPLLVAASPNRSAAELVARARLLGLPAALLGEAAATTPNILSDTDTAMTSIPGLLVVDLSSMWAGPLCGRLLAAAGATVVKVESPRRPDGARAGNRGFFDWMNSGKLSYAVDFDAPELAELIRSADVVIEGSRPAALARRGLDPGHMPKRPGRVWLRLSGYGTTQPDRVAFGDDAAVAGGLVRYHNGHPLFCGDAIADPLTGLEATRGVLDALARGGGVVVEVAMAAVAATYAALPCDAIVAAPLLAPAVPPHPAHDLGAENDEVHRLVAARRIAC